MDIHDVIIKFIVTYYCRSAYSIHRYGAPVVYARCKLEPRLLPSNRCHVEYFDLALSLSLNSWLTKLRCSLSLKVTYAQD